MAYDRLWEDRDISTIKFENGKYYIKYLGSKEWHEMIEVVLP